MADGTIYRVLEKLLVLNGERISYRALNVEHIGSVYETMMGFRLEAASGRSIAIKAAKKHGAPSTINLEELLAEAPKARARWIQVRTDHKLTPKVRDEVQTARTLNAIHASLDSIIDKKATPDLILKDAMILQPSPERRRSGSHYTPRELTEPIVRRALEPILERIAGQSGKPPLPHQILALKICDPAAGSGAFLVEACRQLADALVTAWHVHAAEPSTSSAEDEIALARRIVARRCIYGVDRNPTAVDLSKLSLWLLTLSRDLPLTFVDHAIRGGDSLVGLSLQQIEAFHWSPEETKHQVGFESMRVHQCVSSISGFRKSIQNEPESTDDVQLREHWIRASTILDEVRLFGDLVVASFFEGRQPKERERIRSLYAESVVSGTADEFRGKLVALRTADPPIAPFHWEIEFPEVFNRSNPGFDGVVGNPPFAGKSTLAAGNVSRYPEWLGEAYQESHGNADLVAYFFRRAFEQLRMGGTFGLIATNTIAQGDTRTTGLRWICGNGGTIFHAIRRLEWPGFAAVVVSTIHAMKGEFPNQFYLDGRTVNHISAFLFHTGSNENPVTLRSNKNKSFQGDNLLGVGFTFDDNDANGVATSISEMQRLIGTGGHNLKIIQPLIGGREVNSDPKQMHHRYVINFRDYPLRKEQMDSKWVSADHTQRESWLKDGIVPNDFPGAVAFDWPELLALVEQKVKPSRMALPQTSKWNRDVARRWWQFASYRIGLRNATEGFDRVLVLPIVSQHLAFTFLPNQMVFSKNLYVFSLNSFGAFCVLQSRLHEVWARFFGSTLEDRLSYANTDCFQTFPFPSEWRYQKLIESAGRTYFEDRRSILIQNNEGMTKTYNRFTDPNEYSSNIEHLRELHRAMDRATLDAYGWSDIPTHCEFLLDYEVDEEKGRNKKKPYRYRWPDDVRDEVLGRLLELNAKRAAEENQTASD